MTFNIILVLTLISSQLYLSGNGQEEQKSFTVGCEFDLVDELKSYDPDILKLLPVECETADTDPTLREAMIKESLLFEEFMTALGEREEWEEQGKDDERLTLDLNTELRESVYGDPDGNCTMTSDTSKEFIDCMTEYRLQMLNILRDTP